MPNVEFEFLSRKYRAFCNTHHRWLGSPKDTPEAAFDDLEKHKADPKNRGHDVEVVEITRRRAFMDFFKKEEVG